MSEKTCYTYKQVKVPVKAHELAQEIAKAHGERLADTWINSLEQYSRIDSDYLGGIKPSFKSVALGYIRDNSDLLPINDSSSDDEVERILYLYEEGGLDYVNGKFVEFSTGE